MTLRCWGGFLRLKKLQEAWGSGNPTSSWNSSTTQPNKITAFGIGLWRWTSQGSYLNIFSSLVQYLKLLVARVLNMLLFTCPTCCQSINLIQTPLVPGWRLASQICWGVKQAEPSHPGYPKHHDIGQAKLVSSLFPDVLGDAGFHSRHFQRW